MTDKQINKWLRRQFSVLGWILIGYYLLINAMTMLTYAWQMLVQMRGLIGHGRNWWTQLDTEALLSNAWGYVAAIGVLFFVLYAWKGPDYWRYEVFRREKPITVGALFAVLCMCTGSQMINGFWVSGLEWLFNQADKSLMPILETVSGSSDTFSMFLYASLLAPIAEELLFRGLVLRTLRPYGRKIAIFGSAFLFGLFHGNLLQTPYAFLMGLVLGYVTVEYSVVWAIWLHVFNNMILADLLTRLTAGLPAEAGAMVQTALCGSCLVISCVILLVKRRTIGEYLRSEWMDRRVLKCFFFNWGIVLLTLMMIVNIALMIGKK